MPVLKFLIIICLLLVAAGTKSLAAEQKSAGTTFRIVVTDPGDGTTIASGDKLYLRLSYESVVPVRFQAEAFRQGVRQDDIITSSTPPYDAGRGEALAWISFTSPIRIDELRVTAFDMEWQELGAQTAALVVTWEGEASTEPRAPAEWVGPMLKRHRQVFDQAFDPQPEKPAPLFDIFFLISIMAIPLYLAMQIKMLVRCPSGWKRYVIAPLLPIVPLCLYSLFGLGMKTAYWIIFLFRFFPAALAYLTIVWVVKWFYDRRQRAASPR
jgi:hypothetical protein